MLEALRGHYGRPPRAYHHFGHVLEVLERFGEVAAGPGWAAPAEAYLAVLYHDAIYVPGRKDNEAESARLAVAHIGRWLSAVAIDRAQVARLIELTALHGSVRPGTVSADEALLLDSDMAILGAPPERYAQYEAEIAQEYADMDERAYATGRAAFLNRLLGPEPIFLSEYFRQRLEAQARENLASAAGLIAQRAGAAREPT